MKSVVKIFLYVIISSLVVSCSFVGGDLSSIELPEYKVISASDNIEVREYKPMLLASVTSSLDRKPALNDGFKTLASYIFGNNNEGVKIPMTAPVMAKKVEKGWKISFMMPSNYNMNNLPLPKDSAIDIHEQKSHSYVVIRFSGFNSEENLTKNESLLSSYIKTNKINVIGNPIYAFYNPPWTIPFFKRNEILMLVTKDA